MSRTNNEVRQNYAASFEHHKAFIALYQVKVLIAKDDEKRTDDMLILNTHVHNLVEVVDGYKSIPANDEIWKG